MRHGPAGMPPRDRRAAKEEREETTKAEKSSKAKQQEEVRPAWTWRRCAPACCLSLSAPERAQDEYWSAAGEGSKSKAGKKRDEDEGRKAEAAAKKAEAKRLADAEERALADTGKKGGKVAPPKVTAAQLAAAQEAEKAAREATAQRLKQAQRKELSSDACDALVGARNANRETETLDARGLDGALKALDSLALDDTGASEKHPEKRMKAAWAAYEAAELPALQADKPGMKRQQYREALWKSWQKSPLNPLVAAAAARGASSANLTSQGPPDSDEE